MTDERLADEATTDDTAPYTDSQPETGEKRLNPGSTVGRFVVVREVGRGGMGRVIRAYDPKLQREVALKELIQGELDEEAIARLIAEARSMAKLSHPNVVSVYDVEREPHIVLVMEYVPGTTLREWLRETRRPWSEVLERFIDAGRGLAAAHSAEVLHRDFKPANVLVANDDAGTVKVTDFGLAKGMVRPGQDGASESADEGSEELRTAPGMVVGTPRYMAPEQHRGLELGPAVDQYAFCVSLWEALCTAPPFAGRRLASRKAKGPPPWPNRSVPRRISDAIVRGLAPDPSNRWPSMEALLEALSNERRTSLVRTSAAIAGVAAAGLVAVSSRSGLDAPVPCAGASEQLSGVWDRDVRGQVLSDLSSIEVPYAEDVAGRAGERLDRYAERWSAMHTETCEATTVRKEQSERILDLRMSCLDRARVELAAATQVLTTADREVLDRADDLLDGLPPLSRCEDVEALEARVEPPLRRDAAEVDAIRTLLARARADLIAGKPARAREKLNEARETARYVEYAPVHVEVGLFRGTLLDELGRFEEARDALRDTLHLALQLRQRQEAQLATSKLIGVVGARLHQPDRGEHYWQLSRGLTDADPLAEAEARHSYAVMLDAQGLPDRAEHENLTALRLLDSVVGPFDPLVISTRVNLAANYDAMGKPDRAEAELREVVALRERRLGSLHPDTGRARHNLANALFAQGRLLEAEVEHRRALQSWEQSLGPEHPLIAMSRGNLAVVLEAQGQYEEAEAEYRRIIGLIGTTLAPRDTQALAARTNLANILLRKGQFEAAEDEHRAVLETREKLLGHDHPETLQSQVNLGVVLEHRGRYEEASAYHRRAAEGFERVLGPDHPLTGIGFVNLAVTLQLQARFSEALPLAQRGRRILHTSLGKDHPNVAMAGTATSSILLELGRVAEAETLAAASWEALRQTSAPPDHVGETAFVLARCRWQNASNRTAKSQARALAVEAERAYIDAGPSFSPKAEAVRAWLRRPG